MVGERPQADAALSKARVALPSWVTWHSRELVVTGTDTAR